MAANEKPDRHCALAGGKEEPVARVGWDAPINDLPSAAAARLAAALPDLRPDILIDWPNPRLVRLGLQRRQVKVNLRKALALRAQCQVESVDAD